MELKPCPFCGSEKINTLFSRITGDAVIKCKNCEAEVRVSNGDVYSTMSSFDEIIKHINKACDKWNKRDER